MRFDAHYLIEPRSGLAERLRGKIDPDLAEVVLEPAMLANSEGGRTSWGTEDHIPGVKVTYLASLRPYTGLDTDDGFEAAFGTRRISLELFDRWWTIRLLPDLEHTRDLKEHVVEWLHSIDPDGHPRLEDWFDRVRKTTTPAA